MRLKCAVKNGVDRFKRQVDWHSIAAKIVQAIMNITTSVGSFDKLNCLQGVVDESTSAKRYISQTQSI